MIERYTVSTFVAWWIGAGVGYLLATISAHPGRWSVDQTVVLIYTVMLYAVYFLLLPRGQELLERVKVKMGAKAS